MKASGALRLRGKAGPGDLGEAQAGLGGSATVSPEVGEAVRERASHAFLKWQVFTVLGLL